MIDEAMLKNGSPLKKLRMHSDVKVEDIETQQALIHQSLFIGG